MPLLTLDLHTVLLTLHLYSSITFLQTQLFNRLLNNIIFGTAFFPITFLFGNQIILNILTELLGLLLSN